MLRPFKAIYIRLAEEDSALIYTVKYCGMPLEAGVIQLDRGVTDADQISTQRLEKQDAEDSKSRGLVSSVLKFRTERSGRMP
jgi:hypothetical protein